MFDQLGKILDIGVHDSAVLDTYKGKIHGNNANMIIDDSLIPQIKFINEGSFNETEGKPTLKLIGTVKGKEIVTKDKYTSIRTPDIINSFLNQDLPIGIESEEIVRQLPYESSAYLPLYYFIDKAGLDIQSTIEILENSKSSGSTRSKLIERLEEDDKVKTTGSLTANNKQTVLRKNFLDKILKEELSGNSLKSLKTYNLKYLMESITHLNNKQIKQHLDFIMALLKNIYDMKPKYDNKVYGSFRKTICYIDKILYR